MFVELLDSMERFNMAFSKRSLANSILKEAYMIFYVSVYHWFTLKSGNYDIIINYRVDSASLTTFKRCSVILT